MSLRSLRVSLRSSAEAHSRCGSLVFIAISVLTFLYTIVKASYMGIVLSDTIAALALSFLQYITSTAIVLLKIGSVLFAGLKFRRICVILLVIHIILDIAITIIAFYIGSKTAFIPLLGTFGSIMDLTIYSLFLRLQKEKTN
ncbi:hypothetical protein Y032_0436g1443 [Ancylostoma ceylanicum]|uniref:Uncharacterized protein n=1 Tax=Ancylostoma ceylanicum TaxID=53326 RepID=A0A016WZE8_9BILA|nr:hypothetical protein Y032_0436g1443 [Ancylostoma ceylanicum]